MSMISEMCDNLNTEWKILQNQWNNSRQQWRDAVAERFEREFWQEWEEVVPCTLQSIVDLDDILSQALRNTATER